MGTSQRRGLSTAILALVVVACAKEDRVDPSKAVFESFRARVDSFIVLHNHLADSVGALDQTKSQAEIAARAAVLANALTASRANAKPGDILTPEAATLFATIITQEYSRRSAPVQNARADAQRELEHEEVADFEPAINQVWPTQYALPTFPASLLALLPQLPEQLEYRIVRHYLLLRDIEANLIVDYMPHAVPEP